jgi:TRAP-type C4-dicarboxylate transport system substrate-binding protein
MDRRRFLLTSLAGSIAAPLAAEAQKAGLYKPEFRMSIVVGEETPWGRAATQIKNYFDGRLFADQQTTEFALLQQGAADFAIGSTINWSSQVTELNLFALPFMFPGYAAVDAVQAGECCGARYLARH